MASPTENNRRSLMDALDERQQAPVMEESPTQPYREMDFSDYVPPQKKRTSARVAKIRAHLRPKLLSTIDEFDEMETSNPEHRRIVVDRLRKSLPRLNVQLSDGEYRELEEGLVNDLLGFGAIEPLVQNKQISEIMVNGPEVIFVEAKGKLIESDIVFDDEEHLQWTAQRIVRPLQRDLSRRNPMVDARLPDGSRVHVVMPPSSLAGTTITIRKFPEKPLTVEDLVSFGSFTPEVARFL
ncbi:MAG: Flp pilus assembly complex ATPase component TadA, partial [Chloroflexi bacterium]|nr:Flp pilus assembly complex ATPase component TadA [Chloroflexota bacterium]